MSLKKNEALIRALFDSAAIIILCLYPFRNIHHGLDLWDTAYSYANFEYMGLEHMDPMWLFSTYLSTAIGHVMTLLPYGHTLLGMNFYTSFVPALTAFISYLFFTRILKVPEYIAFIGEFAALSMCWAPTGSLYHYLTYFVIDMGAMLLYRGLTEDEPLTLIASGALLGLGVFIRFSNLPQVSLILAIWLYGIFEFREAYSASDSIKKPSRVEYFMKTFTRCMWYLVGYMASFVVFITYLGIRYGLSEYLESITELMNIPDTAAGYSPIDMIRALIRSYTGQIYWMLRLLFFAVVAGGIFYGLYYLCETRFKNAGDKAGSVYKSVMRIAHLAAAAIAVFSIAFITVTNEDRRIVDFNYRTYWCVFGVASLMTGFALIMGLVVFFNRKAPASERLLSVLAVFALLISAIGSNNGAYSTYNNMFLWFPFMLMIFVRFIKCTNYKWSYGLKYVMGAVVLFFMIQSTIFGSNFAFTEGCEGSEDRRGYIVTDNRVLKNIRMSYDKAYSLERLSAYIQEYSLTDREVITYGYIPGMSFYLQMPPAFNTWPDLQSYTAEKLTSRIDEISVKIEESESGAEVGEYYERPLILLCISENATDHSTDSAKWDIIYDFIEKEGYHMTYSDDMFALYE